MCVCAPKVCLKLRIDTASLTRTCGMHFVLRGPSHACLLSLYDAEVSRYWGQAPPEPGQAWLNFCFNQQDILRHLPTVA